MIFWIAILAGVLFVWLAIRMGFYETWALFFNTVVSIYVSVFLTPMLIEFVPAPSGAASYHVALCLIVLAGGVFALLQGLSYVFLTGQFHIPFPRVFDIVLSGVARLRHRFPRAQLPRPGLDDHAAGREQDRRHLRLNQTTRSRPISFASPNAAT